MVFRKKHACMDTDEEKQCLQNPGWNSSINEPLVETKQQLIGEAEKKVSSCAQAAEITFPKTILKRDVDNGEKR